jgi:hypothetical protein
VLALAQHVVAVAAARDLAHAQHLAVAAASDSR